jgi:signal transduction histidine kinase
MDNAHAITDWLNELRYHQLLNLTSGLDNSMSLLTDAMKVGTLATDDEVLRTLIPAMKCSVEQMRHLILVLINLVEPDNHSPCSLRKAIEQARMLFAHSLVRRKIKMVVSDNIDTMIAVPFDIVVFAIANLIGNAKDAIGEGGGISVEVDTDDDVIVCHVTDEGRGVAPELRETLFDEGTTTKEQGKGKGLFLTKTTLELNGARIALTKTDEKGSIFTIFFPKYGKMEAGAVQYKS